MQKRILVVDDDEMNLMRTQIILEGSYEVVLAMVIGNTLK